LAADLVRILDLLDQLREALGLQKDLDDAGLVGRVELNEPLLQALLRDRVLVSEALEHARLLVEPLLETS
jgi:hypothetical protein